MLISVNVIEGEPNDRPMTTGNHTVRDIYCCKCGVTLGWKYASHPHNFQTDFIVHWRTTGQGLRGIAEVQGGQVHPRAQFTCGCPIADRSFCFPPLLVQQIWWSLE